MQRILLKKHILLNFIIRDWRRSRIEQNRIEQNIQCPDFKLLSQLNLSNNPQYLYFNPVKPNLDPYINVYPLLCYIYKLFKILLFHPFLFVLLRCESLCFCTVTVKLRKKHRIVKRSIDRRVMCREGNPMERLSNCMYTQEAVH